MRSGDRMQTYLVIDPSSIVFLLVDRPRSWNSRLTAGNCNHAFRLYESICWCHSRPVISLHICSVTCSSASVLHGSRSVLGETHRKTQESDSVSSVIQTKSNVANVRRCLTRFIKMDRRDVFCSERADPGKG
jgi:hypothetical protein